MSMRLLTDVDGDEVSLVKRAANRRRFLLLKGDDDLNKELADILEVPWEHEGALLDEIRKSGISDETVEKAVVAAARLLKGVEGEFSPELIEKLGSEMYPRKNPKHNSTEGEGTGDDLEASESGPKKKDGSARGAKKDGSGRDGELSGKGKAPKVAEADPEEKPDEDPDDVKKETSESTDVDVETANDEGGTVGIQVPVRKEDGTWDLSGVPDDSRPFFEVILEKADQADRTKAELETTREALAKADDTLRHREMIAKAASYSHVAATDDLAPILKAASEKLDSEQVEKLFDLLGAAEARIVKGDLFVEKGRASVNDGTTKSDAWTTAVEKANEMVEKSDSPLSQDQALARIWGQNPDLYAQYLNESGMGVGI